MPGEQQPQIKMVASELSPARVHYHAARTLPDSNPLITTWSCGRLHKCITAAILNLPTDGIYSGITSKLLTTNHDDLVQLLSVLHGKRLSHRASC